MGGALDWPVKRLYHSLAPLERRRQVEQWAGLACWFSSRDGQVALDHVRALEHNDGAQWNALPFRR